MKIKQEQKNRLRVWGVTGKIPIFILILYSPLFKSHIQKSFIIFKIMSYMSIESQVPGQKRINRRNLVAKNPWHFVSPGENAPRIVKALIEIPTGCKAKYELDKESGLIKLDRVLFSAVHYPANYGFIPMSYGDDHDPLDILVLCSVELEVLCLVDAKVIGVMRMKDQGQDDDKVIAVALNDQSVNHYNNIEELPQHLLQQIHRFFEDYKKLEGKEVSVEEFAGREKAYEIINRAFALYKETFIDEQRILEEAERTTKKKEEKQQQKARASLATIRRDSVGKQVKNQSAQ